MTTKKIRITAYVSEQKHRELKACCSWLGISMSNFIDTAIEEKADRENRKYGRKNNLKKDEQ